MQTIGKAFIKYNGKLLKSREGAKFNPGGFERKTVKGSEIHGYAEEVAEPYIEGEYTVTKDTDIDEINSITDGTITFEADTGQTWVLHHAWLEKPGDVTAQEGGKVPFKFIGMSASKM